MGGIGSGRCPYAVRKGRVTEFAAFSIKHLRPYEFPAECRMAASIKGVSHPVTITSTRQHFGGYRRWFRCACGRRCATLYLRQRALRCRTCSGLRYRSQSLTPARRYEHMAEKLWARVSYEDARGWRMPLPRVRQATFDRIADRAEWYEALGNVLAVQDFDRLLCRTGR